MDKNPVYRRSKLLGYTAKVVIGDEDFYVALDTYGNVVELVLNTTERQAEEGLREYFRCTTVK